MDHDYQHDHGHDHDHDHTHTTEIETSLRLLDHDHCHSHDMSDVWCGGDDCCAPKSSQFDVESVAADHSHDHDHFFENDNYKPDVSQQLFPHKGDSSSYDHDHDHSHNSGDACCQQEPFRPHNNTLLNDYSHDHSHDHDHGHDNDTRHVSKASSGSHDCSHDHSHDHDHGHDHGHGHDTHQAHGIKDTASTVPKSTGPVASKHTLRVPTGDEDQLLSLAEEAAASADTSRLLANVCNACDPNSPHPHNVVTTRLRIANLCCAGEERIIRSVLDGLHGVENCSVNVINRYCVVKHCAVPCCAPIEKIVDLLNDQRLGASVAEAMSNEEEHDAENDLNIKKIIHVVTVFALFLAGVIAQRVLVKHPSKGRGVPTPEIPSLVLFLCSIALGLVPVVQAAYVSLVLRHTLDIHTLMLIAVIGAVIDREYLDASLLMSLFIAAEMLEEVVMQRVRRAIRSSNSSQTVPKKALLSSGMTVAVEALQIGDVICVRAGDMIQADGVVVKGEGVVDESALTGEAEPVNKKKTHRVSSGTVVQNGYMEVRVDTNIADSTIRKLHQAVLDVQADKGEYGRIVDRVAVYWTPLVIFICICLLVIGGGVASHGKNNSAIWGEYLHKCLVMLVLACPCALVIAAPIPACCAIATAAKNKVLIRGSTVIEKTGRVSIVASDKTGTLTRGFFKVLDRLSLSPEGDYNPLELAAAVEAKSSHPLANAIVSAHCGCIADMEGELPAAKKIKSVDGVGVTGLVEYPAGTWRQVAVGNDRLLKAAFGSTVSVGVTQQLQLDEFVKAKGGLCVYIVVDNQLDMVLSLSDEIRPEAAAAVQGFQDLGLEVCMLTGDTLAVAEEVCEQVGINVDTHCRARCLPADKLVYIQNLEKDANLRVMMIGDGINDAAALAGASVGVAMGAGGTAMAAAAADIVMMSDNLLRLPATVELCSLSRAIIIQNCVLCIVVKIVAVAVAVTGLLQFWEAVLVDIGTLLLVIINGTRPLAFSGYKTVDRGAVAAINSKGPRNTTKPKSMYSVLRQVSGVGSGTSPSSPFTRLGKAVDDEAADRNVPALQATGIDQDALAAHRMEEGQSIPSL